MTRAIEEAALRCILEEPLGARRQGLRLRHVLRERAAVLLAMKGRLVTIGTLPIARRSGRQAFGLKIEAIPRQQAAMASNSVHFARIHPASVVLDSVCCAVKWVAPAVVKGAGHRIQLEGRYACLGVAGRAGQRIAPNVGASFVLWLKHDHEEPLTLELRASGVHIQRIGDKTIVLARHRYIGDVVPEGCDWVTDDSRPRWAVRPVETSSGTKLTGGRVEWALAGNCDVHIAQQLVFELHMITSIDKREKRSDGVHPIVAIAKRFLVAKLRLVIMVSNEVPQWILHVQNGRHGAYITVLEQMRLIGLPHAIPRAPTKLTFRISSHDQAAWEVAHAERGAALRLADGR